MPVTSIMLFLLPLPDFCLLCPCKGLICAFCLLLFGSFARGFAVVKEPVFGLLISLYLLVFNFINFCSLLFSAYSGLFCSSFELTPFFSYKQSHTIIFSLCTALVAFHKFWYVVSSFSFNSPSTFLFTPRLLLLTQA